MHEGFAYQHQARGNMEGNPAAVSINAARVQMELASLFYNEAHGQRGSSHVSEAAMKEWVGDMGDWTSPAGRFRQYANAHPGEMIVPGGNTLPDLQRAIDTYADTHRPDRLH